VDSHIDVPFAVKIETSGPENCQNLALFGTLKIFAPIDLVISMVMGVGVKCQ